jgi:hypothetical protein
LYRLIVMAEGSRRRSGLYSFCIQQLDGKYNKLQLLLA